MSMDTSLIHNTVPLNGCINLVQGILYMSDGDEILHSCHIVIHVLCFIVS